MRRYDKMTRARRDGTGRSPLSARIFRCRDMRDCPMPVRSTSSLTESSPSRSTADGRIRSRTGSESALSISNQRHIPISRYLDIESRLNYLISSISFGKPDTFPNLILQHKVVFLRQGYLWLSAANRDRHTPLRRRTMSLHRFSGRKHPSRRHHRRIGHRPLDRP